MTSFVYQLGESILGRSWGEPPRKGEVVSLLSERRWPGRRRYRVIEVEHFATHVAGDGGDVVFEPGEVLVHVVQLGDEHDT